MNGIVWWISDVYQVHTYIYHVLSLKLQCSQAAFFSPLGVFFCCSGSRGVPGILHWCPPVAGLCFASTAGGTNSLRSTLEASLCWYSGDATISGILAKALLHHTTKRHYVATSRPITKLCQNLVQLHVVRKDPLSSADKWWRPAGAAVISLIPRLFFSLLKTQHFNIW